MVSVGLIWSRAFLTLRVGFGFDEKGRPKMNLIASGAVAAFRFAFLVLQREEPSNIATLEGGVPIVLSRPAVNNPGGFLQRRRRMAHGAHPFGRASRRACARFRPRLARRACGPASPRISPSASCVRWPSGMRCGSCPSPCRPCSTCRTRRPSASGTGT